MRTFHTLAWVFGIGASLCLSCALAGTTDDVSGENTGAMADNEPLTCVEMVADATNTCFDNMTGAELCTRDDVVCWLSCFDASATCSQWATCVEADCSDASSDGGGGIDDDGPTCEERLAGEVEECFAGLTADDVCSTNDADCWVACFEHANDCAYWADCVESVCVNGEDPPWDDDIDDDDTAAQSCEDVVSEFVTACPEADFATVYQVVCEDNADPECMEFCLDEYDDCLDISHCYDWNACV